MSVVIDEVVQEYPPEAVAETPAQLADQSNGTGAQPTDIQAMTFEYRRRQHRFERLWAD